MPSNGVLPGAAAPSTRVRYMGLNLWKIYRSWAENKIGTLLHLEGAEAIGQDLQVLPLLV